MVGDITSARVGLDGCLEPNAYVNDAGVQSIGPIILEDFEVVLVLERNRIKKLKLGGLPRN